MGNGGTTGNMGGGAGLLGMKDMGEESRGRAIRAYGNHGGREGGGRSRSDRHGGEGTGPAGITGINTEGKAIRT